VRNKILWIFLFLVLAIKPTFGEKLGPIMRLGRGFSPVIAYDSKNKNFFVIWSASVPNGKLQGSLFSLDGNRSSIRSYSLPLLQNSPTFPNILFEPEAQRFLLVWQEKNENVFTRFVDASGSATPITQIHNNDIEFGVFGILAVRQNQTGKYLINASSARLFILDQNGSIIRKSDNLKFGSMKIFSSQHGSGYSVFGSNGGKLVFQNLDEQGRAIDASKIVLNEGTWWPLAFSTISAAFDSENNQYLVLYLAQPSLSIHSVRINISGKLLGQPHEFDKNVSRSE
jgi:hypothetical protein